jgi:pimeloyl-ACP methyl ester carboxylesterase
MKKYLCVVPLFILFCFAFSCKQAEKAADEKGAEPAIIVDTAISADGVPISYEVRGTCEPALIFVHGWCCGRSYWNEQLPHFAQKYKVISVDLAGHGESGLDRKEWTMEAFGDDVVAVAEKLNLKQVVLIGHSMGGIVILKAALKMPERILGLVAVDEFFNLEAKSTSEKIEKFLAPFRSNFTETVGNWVRTLFTPKSDSKLVERIVADMSACPPSVALGAATGVDGTLEFGYNMDNRLIRTLQALKAPIVFINSDSQPTEIEINRKYLPSFNAKVVPGVGHFVMLEVPKIFNGLLEESIQEFIQQAAR